jgi:S-adenosylmethionine:tRNA ribosyltransferase-isomerase
MKLSDFNFNLPDSLIALRPVRPRPTSRLLVAADGGIQDQRFFDLPKYLRPGDRLVLNDTKVVPARLIGQRKRISDQGTTFASLEVTLLSLDAEGNWTFLAKPGRRVLKGETIVFSPNLSAEVLSKSTDGNKMQFSLSGDAFDKELSRLGQIPLPPYIASRRAADAQDIDDYQTVFAQNLGAVAAPTASLHFDESLLDKLGRMGVCFTKVTLHVGAGTFLPVKTDDISKHKMHAEWGQISELAASQIMQTKSEGGRIIPVGTTALRLLEAVAAQKGSIKPWIGDTDIFIKPGFRFAVADGLITNFHLPKSTLMMLVSAFMGVDRMKKVYGHAIDQNYRFFSYGDSSLLLPDKS